MTAITAKITRQPDGLIRVHFSDMGGLSIGHRGDPNLNSRTTGLLMRIENLLGVNDVYTQVDGATSHRCIVVVCLSRNDDATAISVGKSVMEIVEGVVKGVKINDEDVFWLVTARRTSKLQSRRL